MVTKITQIKPTDKESQLAGGRPFVYGHALSSTRDKQGQTKFAAKCLMAQYSL